MAVTHRVHSFTSDCTCANECIDASYQAGKAIPADLRCTSRGGLAVTASTRELIAARAARHR